MKLPETFEEVLENRLKWIKGLAQPHRKKTEEVLESVQDRDHRCCLGHGCDIFGLPSELHDEGVSYGFDKDIHYAPRELICLLGLLNEEGRLRNSLPLGSDSTITKTATYTCLTSLAEINDKTTMTTQEIGKWIEENQNTLHTPFLTREEWEAIYG